MRPVAMMTRMPASRARRSAARVRGRRTPSSAISVRSRSQASVSTRAGKQSGRLSSALRQQEGHEVSELLLAQLLAVVLRHQVVGEPLGDFRVRIDDRLEDEVGVLVGECVVEVRADLCRRAGRRERVAGRARRNSLFCEDFLAGLGISLGERPGGGASLGRDGAFYGLGLGGDVLPTPAADQSERKRDSENEPGAHRAESIPRSTAR